MTLSILSAALVVPIVVNAQTSSIDLDHGLIFLPIVLGGDTLTALFDTGAEASAIDVFVAERLGLHALDSVEVVGTNAVIKVAAAMVDGCRIGEHALPSAKMTVRDLSSALAPRGKRLDMIAGGDLFIGRVLGFDLVAHTIHIDDEGMPSRPTPTAIPFTLDHGIPRFQARLNGIAVDLRLDTGASLFDTPDLYVNVTSDTWEQLHQADTTLQPEQYFSATGINNETLELPVARLTSFSIGPGMNAAVDPRSAHVIVQPRQGYFAQEDAVGFVSNNWLKLHGRFTLDMQHNVLIPGH